MEHDKEYQKASRRVMARIYLYLHFLVYAGVNAALIYINLATSPEYWWFKWPLLGWGLGLFFHAIATVFYSEASDLKGRMIEKELSRQKS